MITSEKEITATDTPKRRERKFVSSSGRADPHRGIAPEKPIAPARKQ